MDNEIMEQIKNMEAEEERNKAVSSKQLLSNVDHPPTPKVYSNDELPPIDKRKIPPP